MIVVRSACIYRCFKRSTTALLTINQNHHYNQTFVAKPRLLLLPILLTTKLLLLILFSSIPNSDRLYAIPSKALCFDGEAFINLSI